MTPRPLASFLTRLVWLCMAPLLLLAFWLAWDSLQEQESKHRREGANLAHNFAASIDQRLEARINALHMLAVSPLVDDPARWPELYAEAQGYRKSFGVHVIFADHERQMLFNTRQPYGAKLPRLPDSKGKTAAPLALATGQPQVGDIVFGPVAKIPLVSIAVPVLRTGEPSRLLLSIFETAQFQPRLEALALPPGWSIALQDGTGADIARRSPPGFDGARDVDADHRFVAHLEHSSWSVVLEIPRSSHWHEYGRSLVTLAVGIVLATLLGFFGGRLASRRLSREMQALSAPPGPARAAPGIAEIAAARQALDQAAIERRGSEERFRRLFQEAPLPLCYVNRDGVLVDRNRRFDETFGYGHDELRTLDDWWPLAYPDPAYRAWVLDTWNAAVAEAAQSGADIAPIEYRVACKDGAARNMVISGIALGEDFLATFFDVSERRKAEQTLRDVQAVELKRREDARMAALNQMEDANRARRQAEASAAALRESQERLQLLIDHAPAALAMFDRDMRYLAASQRWRDDYALGEREILGYSHYDIFPEIPERWKAVHRRGLAGEVIATDEDRFDRADGSVQWLRWLVRPWHAHDDSVGGIVLFSEDITRLMAARQEILDLNAGLERRVVERTAELTAANKELDAFAYAVSHDLRAPLRAMNGFAQALEEDYGSQLQGEAKTYLDQIGIASRRMGDLIEGILTLSRSTRGELRRDAVDLSALASRCLEDLTRQEPQRRVEWEVSPKLAATGDARMLEAVVLNLIGNAWKYSAGRDPAHIRFYAEVRDGQTWFCVSDNGAGFDPAHAARLFQPFQRLHRQDEFPGIGIGLATVQRIIHRHGGKIEARGGVGQGAMFCFTLGTDA
jgi:PAS domain S-box-containing protein